MIRLLRGLFARVPVLAGDLTVSLFDIRDRRDGWGWGGNVEDRPWLHDGGLPRASYWWAVDQFGKDEADRLNDGARQANEPRP